LAFALLLAPVLRAQEVLTPETAPDQAKGDPIEITADGENRYEAGVANAEGNVVVRYRGNEIFADRVTYNSKTRSVICKGNVRIYTDDGKTYRGDVIIFNFDTKEMQSADFRGANFPLEVAGGQVTSPGLNHYRIHDGFFTTDNRSDPAFRLRASTVEVYPNDQIVMKNCVIYIGPVPVGWVPIYAQSLKSGREGYHWSVGTNNRFGAFFYNKYNFDISPNMFGTVHLDYRSKRGFAGGVDIDYQKNATNKAIFRAYYAEDELYQRSRGAKDQKYRYGQVDTSHRYRASLKSRTDVGSDLSIITDVGRWSDPLVTLDYFEGEYRHEVQPHNHIEVLKYDPNYTLSLYARPDINPFFETLERKPEARLEMRDQKIFGSPVSYKSETSIASLNRAFARDSLFNDYRAYRWDTFHEFSYPKQYFNWLSVTPKFGLRGTVWSDDNRFPAASSPDNPYDPDSRARLAPNFNLEASFKVSKTWADIQNREWGIYGLRHVMEPFINAQYIPDIVGARPSDIRQFDQRLLSTRLQPLTFPDFNSVDSIDQMAVIRHGIRNKLQTKRDGRNYDLIDWVVYADLDLQKNFSAFGGNNYSNVFSDLLLMPVNWLYVRSEAAVDILGDSFTEFNNSITWMPDRSLRLTAGNRFLTQSPLFPNSNLYYMNLFWRINEHWQLETNHMFEADTGKLMEQAYTVYRDLSAWQLGATFKERDINNGTSEILFYLTLTLKAFPSFDITTNSLQ
jgi:LPS-assembly protein